MHQKFNIKKQDVFQRPPCGKVGSCPCKEKCSPSPYGRCVYTKPDRDIRLYIPVPRGTEEYKEIHNNRTSCERVNNRVLNDYHLHNMGIHTGKRYSFFSRASIWTHG